NEPSSQVIFTKTACLSGLGKNLKYPVTGYRSGNTSIDRMGGVSLAANADRAARLVMKLRLVIRSYEFELLPVEAQTTARLQRDRGHTSRDCVLETGIDTGARRLAGAHALQEIRHMGID